MNDSFNDYGIKKYGILNGYKDINCNERVAKCVRYHVIEFSFICI